MDCELSYAAAMLRNFGLSTPVPQIDFTATSILAAHNGATRNGR